jgi:hypothetical protein
MIYRTVSPENGFEIRAVLLHETIPGGSWHLVADPGIQGKVAGEWNYAIRVQRTS